MKQPCGKKNFFQQKFGRIWGGGLTARGPEVRRVFSTEMVLQGSADEFEEFRTYALNHGPFTLDDPWDDSPKPFQRRFQSLWNRDGKGQQTDFFESWDISELTNQITELVRVGNELLKSQEDAVRDALRAPQTKPAPGVGSSLRLQADIAGEIGAKLIEFVELRKYHIFAIPKHIYSKGAFKTAMTELTKALSKRLLGKRQMFGTTTEWATWLGVKALQKDGALSGPAAQLAWIEKRFPHNSRQLLKGKAAAAARRAKRQAHQGDVQLHLNHMEQLCGWVFPVFEWNKFLFVKAQESVKEKRK